MVERKHLDYYVRRGFRVTPVAHDEKRPLLKGWLDQTIGLEDLPRYFPEGTPLNVGLVTGDGLVDVDVDSAEARLLAPLLLPPTGMRHGRVSLGCPTHYWYRVSDGGQGRLRTIRYLDPVTQSCLVELRHGGVQTVVPPSTLGGDALIWYRDGDAPLKPGEVPAWQIDRRVRLLAAGAMLLSHWRDGVRHELSLSLSGALAKLGWGEDESLEFLDALASASGDREWRDRLESVRSTFRRVRSGQRVMGLKRLKELLPEVVVQRLGEWLRLGAGPSGGDHPRRVESKSCAADPGWELPRLIRFDEVQADVADELVPNLLYAGKCTILAGAPGVGKSTFALDLADALSRPKGEGRIWGQFVTGGYRVLWLDFDESFARFKAIADRFYGSCHRDLFVVPRSALHPLTAETYGYYKRLIEENRIDVMVVDTMHDWFQTEDANNAMLARDRLSWVRLLCEETGVAILLLDHVRKGAMESDRVDVSAVAGSVRWAGKVDGVAVLRRAPRAVGEGEGVIASYARQMRAVLSVVKCRYGTLMDLPVRMEAFRFIPESEVPRSYWSEYCGPARAPRSENASVGMPAPDLPASAQPVSAQPVGVHSVSVQSGASSGDGSVSFASSPSPESSPSGQVRMLLDDSDWDARLDAFLEMLVQDEHFGLDPEDRDRALRVFRKACHWGYPRVWVRHEALSGGLGGSFVGGDVQSWYEIVSHSAGTDVVDALERALDDFDWDGLLEIEDRSLRRVLVSRARYMGGMDETERGLVTRLWELSVALGFPEVQACGHMRVYSGRENYMRAIPAFPSQYLPDWVSAMERFSRSQGDGEISSDVDGCDTS